MKKFEKKYEKIIKYDMMSYQLLHLIHVSRGHGVYNFITTILSLMIFPLVFMISVLFDS